jgi:transposase
MGRHGDHSLACYRIGEAQSSQRLPPFELSGTVRALAKNLRKLWPALWTFAEIPDVDPTNNAAERGLRAAVIYRKLSLGSRSHGGQRTIERLLSVDQTCRLQRRSLCAYLSDALAAKARGDRIPALA